MNATYARPGADQPSSNLHVASGVARRDNYRTRRLDVVELRTQHTLRRFGLNQVVDPRAPTTSLRVHQWNEFHTWNGTEEFERRIRDALRVMKVTGSIARDPQWKTIPRFWAGGS